MPSMLSSKWKLEIKPDVRINDFKLSLRKRIVKRAINKGSRLVAKKLKEILPKVSGALRVAIGVKIISKSGDDLITGLVGAKNKYQRVVGGKLVKPAKYLHLVNWGHRAFKQVIRAVSGKGTGGAYDARALLISGQYPRASANIGAAPAGHQMEDAFSQSKDNFTQIVMETIKEGIEKQLSK